jgi:hypothetical protein
MAPAERLPAEMIREECGLSQRWCRLNLLWWAVRCFLARGQACVEAGRRLSWYQAYRHLVEARTRHTGDRGREFASDCTAHVLEVHVYRGQGRAGGGAEQFPVIESNDSYIVGDGASFFAQGVDDATGDLVAAAESTQLKAII